MYAERSAAVGQAALSANKTRRKHGPPISPMLSARRSARKPARLIFVAARLIITKLIFIPRERPPLRVSSCTPNKSSCIGPVVIPDHQWRWDLRNSKNPNNVSGGACQRQWIRARWVPTGESPRRRARCHISDVMGGKPVLIPDYDVKLMFD